MIRALAIDDEPLALRQIKTYIERIPFLELAATFNNAVEARRWLQENEVDLIFVDINMPDLTGVDFVRSLTSPPMIIFTTAYSEYAIEGFRLDAIDYLLKPFGFNDLLRAATKAQSLYELRMLQLSAAPNSAELEVSDDGGEATDDANREYISIRADHKVSLVRLANIVYLESEGEYVRITLADGAKIVTLFRLKNMERMLPSDMFMRVHRSYIVNLNYVSGYTKGRIYLSDDDYVPIGDNYKEQFAEYIRNKS